MSTATTQKIIGAHVSASGGVQNAVERAAAIGCNAVQVFSGSPRVWKKPILEIVDVDKINANREQYSVGPIFTHALYLVNLASDKAELVEKSVNSLVYELQFDALIGGSGVVVHLGSHQGRGFAECRSRVAELIEAILTQTPEHSTFLIENAAAQNGKVGGRLTEVAELLELLETSGKFVSAGRLGWCFDTCHGFAAGYTLDGEGESTALAEMKRLGLLDSLKCIHVNDSRDPLASGRDRHANLGDGLIPAGDLKHFLRQPALANKPLITEVPGLDNEGPDAENISRLKKLAGVE